MDASRSQSSHTTPLLRNWALMSMRRSGSSFLVRLNFTGNIQGIGTISSVVKAPAVGLAVEKSGRTTGTTAGIIGSTNTSVNVQYQTRCGQGKKYIISYTNQIVINGSGFNAGGDSGSLIVTSRWDFSLLEAVAPRSPIPSARF
jgi:hypothetical protein